MLPFSINIEQWSDAPAVAERLDRRAGRGVDSPAREAAADSRLAVQPRDRLPRRHGAAEDVVAGDGRRRSEQPPPRRNAGLALRRPRVAGLHLRMERRTDGRRAGRPARQGSHVQNRDAAAPDGKRNQTWRFSSRNECLRCHNPWSEYALAFTVPQLNRDARLRRGAATTRLRTLSTSDCWRMSIEPASCRASRRNPNLAQSPEVLPRLTSIHRRIRWRIGWHDRARARSYLHVNCAHCHRFNGGGSS